MKRLQQLEARWDARGGKRLKRPAAAAKNKSQKKKEKENGEEKHKKRTGDKVDGEALKDKPKPKAKGKAKAKGKKPRKPTEKKASAKAAPKHKPKSKDSKGPKSTFARRLQSKKEPMASFWAAVRGAFEATIEARVRCPSSLEEGLRFWGSLKNSDDNQSILKIVLNDRKFVVNRNHGGPFL